MKITVPWAVWFAGRMLAFTAFAPRRFDRAYGPGRKDSTRVRARSKYMPHQGESELKRRRRQIASGALRPENGLVLA